MYMLYIYFHDGDPLFNTKLILNSYYWSMVFECSLKVRLICYRCLICWYRHSYCVYLHMRILNL